MFIPCNECECNGSAKSGSSMCVSCEQNKSTIETLEEEKKDLIAENDTQYDKINSIEKQRDEDTARIFHLEGRERELLKNQLG